MPCINVASTSNRTPLLSRLGRNVRRPRAQSRRGGGVRVAEDVRTSLLGSTAGLNATRLSAASRSGKPRIAVDVDEGARACASVFAAVTSGVCHSHQLFKCVHPLGPDSLLSAYGMHEWPDTMLLGACDRLPSPPCSAWPLPARPQYLHAGDLQPGSRRQRLFHLRFLQGMLASSLLPPARQPKIRPRYLPVLRPRLMASARLQIWKCDQETSNHIVHEFFKSPHFNDGIPIMPGASFTTPQFQALATPFASLCCWFHPLLAMVHRA